MSTWQAKGGRRGNHEGSIRQRPDGRREARITLEGGRVKSFYGTTQQDVVAHCCSRRRRRRAQALGSPAVL
jgi:hypothetical protein